MSESGIPKQEIWTPGKLKQALKYLLQADDKLAKAVERKNLPSLPMERLLPKTGEDFFGILARSIVYQQLSGASALAIWKRLLVLSGDTDKLKATNVAKLSVDDLRSVGMSRPKGGYLIGLADEFVSGRLSNEVIRTMSTNEITTRLVSIKGIGKWTSDMFEIFHLGRQDVLPTGDLAVMRGIQKLYRLDKPPTPKQAESLTEHWRPYRTLGSYLMWVCFQ